MWRTAPLVCLLLPLTAAAITPPGVSGAGAPANDSHPYWPLGAVSRTYDRSAQQVDFIPTGTSMDLAVQEMRQAAAQMAPVTRDSLVHVDLSRHVRLAMISWPVAYTNRFGVTSTTVAIFSLQW